MKHTEQNFSIINARAVLEDGIAENASITVKEGIISSISVQSPPVNSGGAPVFDAKGLLAGPGLIDMHIHGCGGVDTAGIDIEHNLLKMADFLSCRGITSFQPTLVMDMENLQKTAQTLEKHPQLALRIPGAYVEGPFICPEKKGGLPLESLRPFSKTYAEEITRIQSPTALGKRALVKTMVTAPELDGSQELERLLERSEILASWGHSNAFLSDVGKRNPRHLTHLFNAMNGVDHKNPGLAVLPFIKQGKDATFEIICDTVHVNPAVLELVFNSSAVQNSCVISDCMSSGGTGAGESLYLNRQVVCDGRVSRYKDNGVLIGSAMLICDTAKELYNSGLIDERLFFRAASTNPARVLGMSDRGTLAEGKKADIVLCSKSMEIIEIFTH